MARHSIHIFSHSDHLDLLDEATPQIFVVCLEAYMRNLFHGRWITATQRVEEIFDEIQLMLSDSPVENSKTWLIYNFRNFSNLKVKKGESIVDVQTKAQFILEYGQLGVELVTYYGDIDSARDAIQNHYHGEYESELEFATQLFDECYMAAIPRVVQNYIDYSAFKREIFNKEFFMLTVDDKKHIFSKIIQYVC